MSKIKIFSFFSGSGFLDLGFERNGFDISFVNEVNPSFMNAYQYSRKIMGINPPEYGYFTTDINEFLSVRKNELHGYMDDAKKNGCLVGFIGGPPCPDFSVAGKNKGGNGENGRLSLSYINLIIEMKPDFFLFENVKGLWKTARHREFFEELKSKIRSAGYCTTERLVNAIEYGCPQDRERILMFGLKNKLANGHIDGTEITDFPWTKYHVWDMNHIHKIEWPKTNAFEEDSYMSPPDNIPVMLTVEYWFMKNNVYAHPNADDYFIPRSGIQRMAMVGEGDVSRKSYKRLHRWRYSPTVAYGNNEVHLHPYKVRRISVAEALAIQTLPTNFSLPVNMTLTDKFKTIGNGVPFLLATGIAKTVGNYLSVL